MIVAGILLTLLTLASPGFGQTPERLWVASQSSVPVALETLPDARVLDRFPDAFILDDDASAAFLEAQGMRVDGPLRPRPGSQVFLLRRVRDDAPRSDPAAWSQQDARVLWQGGRELLVESMQVTKFATLGAFQVQALRSQPLRPVHTSVNRLLTQPKSSTPSPIRITEFEPIIQEMVDRLETQAYLTWIENLTGAKPVRIGASAIDLQTRHTATFLCDLAEQYVYEQFRGMGFTDVQYDPFTFSGVDARNVVATLPGTSTPERIYILGAHLDSTSPQPTSNAPGGNDNASGIAALLQIANVLKDYPFDATIRFIAFTGEEQGLYGSAHYAAEAAARGDQIQAVIICDMIAWYNNQYQIDIEGRNGYLPFMQVMQDACAAYTGLNTAMKFISFGSDHVPFQNEGFPAFLAIESEYGNYPCYHQTCDIAANNDAGMGTDVARACLATLAHLAGPVATTTAVLDEIPGAGLLLFRNQPNPFNPYTRLRFELSTGAMVQLAVFDAHGRLVRNLLHAPLEPGSHVVLWDGTDEAGHRAPSGTYFSRLVTPHQEAVRKLSLVR